MCPASALLFVQIKIKIKNLREWFTRNRPGHTCGVAGEEGFKGLIYHCK